MNSLFLTDAEIDALCDPLKQASAQVRFLRASGLTVTVKPNGRPAVVRKHAEAVLSGIGPSMVSGEVEKQEASGPRPNIEAFMKVISGGKSHGKAKKVQPA